MLQPWEVLMALQLKRGLEVNRYMSRHISQVIDESSDPKLEVGATWTGGNKHGIALPV